MRKALIGLAAAVAFVALPARADINNFVAFMNGANEAPGPGDPDGFGIGSVTIDTVFNTVSWSFLVNNVAMPLSSAHIHAAPAGMPGSVIVDFSGQMSGANLFDADLASINSGNAANFYLNIHNAAFPGGAIRGQLQFVGSIAAVPEPATFGLMVAGLGVVGLMVSRRRRQA